MTRKVFFVPIGSCIGIFLFFFLVTASAIAGDITDVDIDKHIKKISEDQAMAVDVFKTSTKGVTGVVVRGKNPGIDYPTGQEMLGFVLSPQKIFVTAGELFDEDGNSLPNKYAYKLNHQIIKNLYGRALDGSAYELIGKPTKTVFVFFDPYCGACQKFSDSGLVDKFLNNDIRLIWVPVSIFDDSLAAGSLFLSEGKWMKRGQPLENKANPDDICDCDEDPVVDNTKRMMKLNPGETIGAPLFVWLTGDSGLGYDFYEGIPNINKIKAIAERALPVTYNPLLLDVKGEGIESESNLPNQ